MTIWVTILFYKVRSLFRYIELVFYLTILVILVNYTRAHIKAHACKFMCACAHVCAYL